MRGMGVRAEIDGQQRRKRRNALSLDRDARAKHMHRHDKVGARGATGGSLTLLDGMGERNADHPARALSARLGADPPQCELARVVDALREVAELLVCPARAHPLRASLLPARDDVENARRTDNTERAVPRVPQLEVLLPGKISQHGLRGRRSSVAPNGSADA